MPLEFQAVTGKLGRPFRIVYQFAAECPKNRPVVEVLRIAFPTLRNPITVIVSFQTGGVLVLPYPCQLASGYGIPASSKWLWL